MGSSAHGPFYGELEARRAGIVAGINRRPAFALAAIDSIYGMRNSNSDHGARRDVRKIVRILL
jgi:hypothetical protein